MIRVFIEVETGSCDKNVYDGKTLELRETHHTSLQYPYPYGFITGTTTADGDGVDCYVITKDQLKVGTIVECEAIGLLEQFEDGEVDHKVLALLPGQKVELDRDLLNELRDFIYGIFEEFPDTPISVGRILSREKALDYISRYENE